MFLFHVDLNLTPSKLGLSKGIFGCTFKAYSIGALLLFRVALHDSLLQRENAMNNTKAGMLMTFLFMRFRFLQP